MFHQIQSTAMGLYAYLFMADLEERLLEAYPLEPTLHR
jgi:hypothetical protein